MFRMNLITGATGLLGSHIAEKLRQDDQPVRALVRRGSDSSFLESLGVEIAEGDVTQPDTLGGAMQGVTTVYHAAAKVGDWGPWEQFQAVTIDGTAHMLRAAEAAGVQRFLHVSSLSAYGHPDGEGLVIDESAPLGQNLHRWSYYSRAKAEAEQLVWQAHRDGRVVATVVKPSWLYGERDRASMPRLMRAIRQGKAKIVGDGTNRLNLTYAGNEAEGCILAATRPEAAGQSYNLGDDGEITQQEYFALIAGELGVQPPRRKVPYRVVKSVGFMLECVYRLVGSKKPPLVTRYSAWLIGRRCFFSSEKARRELGWQATVPYAEGVPRAVRWCQEHHQV
jgi:nucleoside-diphosphate-sugar epimerase